MKKLFAALTITLAFPMLAWAADYYVSTTGNDTSGDGSIGSPWLTVQKGITDRSAGDNVYVRGGTYREKAITFNTSGSAGGGYITLKNYLSETPVIDGTDANSNWSGIIQASGKSYLMVDGITITGNAQGQSMAFYGPGSHITIQNCEIYDHVGSNVVFFSGNPGTDRLTNVIFDNCKVHDADTAAYEAVRFDKNVRYFKAINNIIYNHSNIGIDLCAWTHDTGNMPTYGLIEGNLIYNSTDDHSDGSTGIYLDGANHICIQNNTVCACVNGIAVGAEFLGQTVTANIVRRNYVYANHWRGIMVGSSVNHGCAEATSVYNNDAYGNSTEAWSTELRTKCLHSRNIFRNNIAYNLNNYLRRKFEVVDGAMGDSVTANYNCYHIDTGSYAFYQDSTSYTSLSAWQAAVSPHEANSISDDPLFVNGSARNFELQSGSPCIDAGGPLADTTDGGTGTAISVDNAAPFTDGYNGLFSGDVIRIGSNSAVTITAVDIEANTITVHTSISWIIGDPVCMDYSGSAPDIGAFEYEAPTATPTPTPTSTPTSTSTPVPTPTPASKRKGHGILGAQDGPMWPHYLRH